MKSKIALITGVAGQDGSYLTEFLLAKDYKVIGVEKKKENFARFSFLGNIEQVVGDISDKQFVEGLVKKYLPDEIYNFAGVTNVFKPNESLLETVTLNANTPVFFLEAIRLFSPSTKFFQASSAEMYDKKIGGVKDETSIFRPENPYGIAKLFVHNMINIYRAQKVFAVSGIFFNHESPRRGEHFLTRKVTIALSKIKLGQLEVLEVGNIDALRDWGYAKEYVEAMWQSLQHTEASDYVIATGQLHSVREFIETSASALGIKITWEGVAENEIGKDQNGKVIVKINKDFYRKESESYSGDIGKIKRELNWQPRTSFQELVKIMTEADYNNLSKKVTKYKTDWTKYESKSLVSVACPLCSDQGKKENDYELATVGYPGIPVRNVICRNCGLIRINPRLTEQGYIDFYVQDFFDYLNVSERPHYINTIEKTTDPNFVTEPEKYTLPFILPFVKEGGNVLDVGAGFGQILYLLKRKKNVNTFGNEPDPESRRLAKEKMGIELSPDTIEDYLKKNTLKYDYIHIEQVFEHLLSPLTILRDLAKVLNPEGAIYIGVPGQYNYAVAPDRFFELAHTYGYTPATLAKFADMSGLKIVGIKNPLASNLEVIMAHKNSKWPEVDPSLIRYGKKWYVTKNRILGRQKYYQLRGAVKKVLVATVGENVKNFLRKFI